MDLFGTKFDLIRCPVCFAREMDTILYYDSENDEYYCKKCCYTGNKEDVNNFFTAYRKGKYRDMYKEHPTVSFKKGLIKINNSGLEG